MFVQPLEPVLKILGFLFKFLAAFFLIRGMLYMFGFRYNIPVVDDLFWGAIGLVISRGTPNF